MIAGIVALALVWADTGLVPVQGAATDAAGAPLQGSHEVTFAMAFDLESGVQTWAETETVSFHNGAFAHLLGAGGGLELDWFRGASTLSIQVDGGAPSEPTEIAWTPRAAFAARADTLDGLDATAFRLVSDAVPWAQLSGVPSGLADGDNDTTYTPGTGLALNAGAFVASNVPWSALSAATIPAGLSDGDNDTTYSAGSGLTLTGTTFAANLDSRYVVKTNGASVCDANAAGAVRWNGTVFEGCDGASWRTIASAAIGTSANPGQSCLAIKTAVPSSVSSAYWIDPDGANTGNSPFQVYCDMVNDGGGWTLVKIDDSTSQNKSAAAAGTVPAAMTCSGTNVKLSDAVIKSIWTSKLRYTVVADTNGDMTYMSDTNLTPLTSWSDRCGLNNVITWYFKRAPSVTGVNGDHPHYCGWSFNSCAPNVAGRMCWYGPHETTKVHLNASNAHLSIPSNITALGGDQGCGMGWVR
jgi:hypothetical protein